MNKRKCPISILFLVCFLALISQQGKSQIKWVSTTEKEAWHLEQALSYQSPKGAANIVIDDFKTAQPIKGFGACFNELGWKSIGRLALKDRDMIFTELFKPGKGANFSICRMPIGANDFSNDWYSYDDTDGDFELKKFSIKNDMKSLVPFIKEALKQNPEIQLWASPWSPPAWMKWNKHYACALPWQGLAGKFQNQLTAEKQGKEGTNMFIQEHQYFEAYANYFSKFLQAYQQQGIRIGMVMPQNEFNSCQIFPSCTWTAKGLSTFIGEYLGPKMKKLNTDIYFGTMERANEKLVDTILNDQNAGKYIKGVGFQWAGKEAVAGINKRYPGTAIFQTEQECGDGKNDWKYCVYTWNLMKHYFNNGANAYMYWNISLDAGGYSRWGWQQNSLITIDTVSNSYQFNHEYYLLKHLSHFVQSGAKRLLLNKHTNNDLVFMNPDGSIICILFNEDSKDKSISIEYMGKQVVPMLKANSFNTIVLK